MHPEDTRLRRKVLFLTERDFLSCFESVETGFPHRREPGSVNQLLRVRLVGVPPDATVSNMWYDHARMAVGILVTHPSFPELPVGADPEVVFVERTLYQCDHEGKTLAVRDQATYEPIDVGEVQEGFVRGRQMTCEARGGGVTLRECPPDLVERYLAVRRNPTMRQIRDRQADDREPLSERRATPGEAAVCEQIYQAVENRRGDRSLSDIIEECRNPRPPAEPVPFDGAIKTESWRDRPALL